jgi:Oxidoreductase family, NAD-binding Rossmann fold
MDRFTIGPQVANLPHKAIRVFIVIGASRGVFSRVREAVKLADFSGTYLGIDPHILSNHGNSHQKNGDRHGCDVGAERHQNCGRERSGTARADWVGRARAGRLGQFSEQPDVEPVAVCDVYEPFREKGIAMAEGRAKSFSDFRKLLEQRDIDAVIVAAPDHWHALMTIAACDAGKDVYCEKPLTLMAGEGRKMVEAARRNKRVVQTGSQQRPTRTTRRRSN